MFEFVAKFYFGNKTDLLRGNSASINLSCNTRVRGRSLFCLVREYIPLGSSPQDTCRYLVPFYL